MIAKQYLKYFINSPKSNKILSNYKISSKYFCSQSSSSGEKSDSNEAKQALNAKETGKQKANTEQTEEKENIDPYVTERQEDFKKLYTIKYQEDSRIDGYATEEGTQNYSKRNKGGMSKLHFRNPFGSNLKLSSIGMGTSGTGYDEDDRILAFNSYIDAVQSGGVNVLDTSINTMGMSGERILGSVLRYLYQSQNIKRDELFISTKHGKITEDTDQGLSGSKLIGKLISQELIKDTELSQRQCFHPAFLEQQFQLSLANLGVNCIDLCYLNEPNDMNQVPGSYYDRIAKGFEFYEQKIQNGQLRYYGIDSWQGFRSLQHEESVYLNLQKLVELAEKVGGKNHSFKWIQFPLSYMMPEALQDEQQMIKTITETPNPDKEGEMIQKEQKEYLTIFKAAVKYQININCKSPLMGGAALQKELSKSVMKQENISARHIQFSRSTPSEAYLTCVLGTDTEEIIREKLEVLKYDPVNDMMSR